MAQKKKFQQNMHRKNIESTVTETSSKNSIRYKWYPLLIIDTKDSSLAYVQTF